MFSPEEGARSGALSYLRVPLSATDFSASGNVVSHIQALRTDIPCPNSVQLRRLQWRPLFERFHRLDFPGLRIRGVERYQIRQ